MNRIFLLLALLTFNTSYAKNDCRSILIEDFTPISNMIENCDAARIYLTDNIGKKLNDIFQKKILSYMFQLPQTGNHIYRFWRDSSLDIAYFDLFLERSSGSILSRISSYSQHVSEPTEQLLEKFFNKVATRINTDVSEFSFLKNRILQIARVAHPEALRSRPEHVSADAKLTFWISVSWLQGDVDKFKRYETYTHGHFTAESLELGTAPNVGLANRDTGEDVIIDRSANKQGHSLILLSDLYRLRNDEERRVHIFTKPDPQTPLRAESKNFVTLNYKWEN